MKRILWIAALCGVLFTACSKDEEGGDIVWDFWNYNMVFAVSDAAGRDLLDPAVAENLLGNDIRINYRKEEFVLSDQSRASDRGKLALRHGYDDASSRYVLAFGSFSPSDNYHGQVFSIDWGDGTRNDLTFDCYVQWSGDEPLIRKRLLVDGEPTAEGPYLIRLTK